MKSRDDEKLRLCSSPSKLGPISLDLKMTRFPAKFRMKPHQKKLVKREERDGNDNEDDEKDRGPIKVHPIPVDLEVAILSRLPEKSLMRFRCVSKMWSSIIRSQRFVDSYYAMSSAMGSRFIIAFSNGIFVDDQANRRVFIFSSSYEGGESSSLVANLDMEIPCMSLVHGSKCPSVHGFVSCCFDDRFIICNPSMGQVVTLPIKGALTSLGYDPVDGQFKALNLVSSFRHHHDDGFLVHEVINTTGGRNVVTSPLYYPISRGGGLCINGFVYYGAWAPRQRMNPVIVCFDVRYERLSFINAPRDVVFWERDSIFIEYNGKLASIVRESSLSFRSFDLWILEDVKKHDWSKQTFELPFSLMNMTSPGINKAGEFIFVPETLSHDVQPFYIFYYNVERRSIRRVRIHGIADDEGFRRRYGLAAFTTCCVSISPQHVQSIAYL